MRKAIRLIGGLACAVAAGLCRAADILVPRIVTEDVAYVGTKADPRVICCMKDIRPGEHYSGVARSRAFNFFGVALFPRLDQFRPRGFQATRRGR